MYRTPETALIKTVAEEGPKEGETNEGSHKKEGRRPILFVRTHFPLKGRKKDQRRQERGERGGSFFHFRNKRED